MTEIFSSLRDIRVAESCYQKGSWLSIGTFDGVHLGHQALIQKLVEGAHQKNHSAILITFFPHPAEVLHKQEKIGYLTTLEERSQLIYQLGVDQVLPLLFTPELAALSAFEFIQQLKEQVNFQELLVGFNFALGRNRQGDVTALETMGQNLGFHLQVIPPYFMSNSSFHVASPEARGAISIENTVLSSSQIRSLLANGEVEAAARSLGRWYRVSGQVVHGEARGRSLGFATANIEVWPEKSLPRQGVYACWAQVDEKRWPAIVNIGVRPTFEKGEVLPRVEAHLLDFQGDLYGATLSLDFVAHLRNEKRFDSIDLLIQQLNQDKEAAKNILLEPSTPYDHL